MQREHAPVTTEWPLVAAQVLSSIQLVRGRGTAARRPSWPLADFAQQTIPTLQKHLQTAESLTGQKSAQR